jgi:hypothetical protein
MTRIALLPRAALGALALAFAAAAPAQASSPAASTWVPADGASLVFDVYRDGDRFGTHTVTFKREGDTLTVATDIELRVKIGPITAFLYDHEATEIWSGGELQSLASRTRKDGRRYQVSATADADGLTVTGRNYTGRAPVDAVPSTHWNDRQIRQQQLFSTETGEMLDVKVTDQGADTIKAGGRDISARKYFVESDLDFTLWYDASGRWVGCAFEARGSKVTYVLRNG